MMNTKAKLTVTLCAAILSSACLANPGDRIDLGSIAMVSPGQNSTTDVSLKKLSNDKFYTIEAKLHNTNMQEVDYRVTTRYATHADGSVGSTVAASQGVLTKDGNDGYTGHLASTDKDVTILIKNVKTVNGILKKDYFRLYNTSPTKLGSGIEATDIVAIEQENSGEEPGSVGGSV